MRVVQPRYVALFVTVLGLGVLADRLSYASSFQLAGDIYDRVPTSERLVALTFDDGPHDVATARILALLKERSVKATFFLEGRFVEDNMDATRAIIAAGHEIGNHSFSHQHLVLQTPSFIRSEIERTDRAIRAAGYKGERILFRPPFGQKLLLLPMYLYQHDRVSITWDVEPEGMGDAKGIAYVAVRDARPGSIILLHVQDEEPNPSFRAVGPMIDGLRQRGFGFATVSQLLAKASR